MNVLDRDFFSDPEIIRDPNPYYAALHELGPVLREPHHGVFMVSGVDEILAVYADLDSFSSIAAPLGPFTKLPERAEGESIADVLEHRRAEIALSDLLPTLDPPEHTRQRALLNKLFTPNRMRENEEFMWTLADRLIDEFADRGEAEFCSAYAGPFTLLVIADLLGVPREHHDTFRGWLGKTLAGDTEARGTGDPVFLNLYPYFTRYIEERRAAPGDDVMSQLATARFPDGELPPVKHLVSLAVVVFAAGQETTARLLSAGMRFLAEQPSLADELRSEPEGIRNFTEECLRFEGPIKGPFRLALRDTRLAGVDIPAGSVLMAMNGAANRDPRVFADPDRFDARRPNARRNIAFGHGTHFCVGANLARAEAHISFERLLARLDDLRLVDPSALSYAPSFLIRGLNHLPLRFRRRSQPEPSDRRLDPVEELPPGVERVLKRVADARLGRGVGRMADDDVVAHLAVLRVGHLVDIPELHRLAGEPVVLLEPARHRSEGPGDLALCRQIDRGRRLDERALLGRELEPVDEGAGRRKGTALDHLRSPEAHGLAEADEELRVGLVAAGQPPRLLLVDALRELHALRGKRTVGVHRAHGARELAHLQEELDGEELQLLAAELAIGEIEPQRVTAEGPPRLDPRDEIPDEGLGCQNLAHLSLLAGRVRAGIRAAAMAALAPGRV
jgi:cytochrome P450